MPNFKNGKIYGIDDKDGNRIYVGSTCDPLPRRKSNHKSMSRTSKMPFYRYVAENGGWDNFKIVLIEDYPCDNRSELYRREGEHIKKINPVTNCNIPGRTPKELYEATRDKILEQHRKYYEKNKERVREYYEKNKERVREYYEKNKEQKREYARQYMRRKKAEAKNTLPDVKEM